MITCIKSTSLLFACFCLLAAMGKEVAGKYQVSEDLEYYKRLLGTIGPDQLSEVLSEGFCSKCRLLLQGRLKVLLRTNPARGRQNPREFTPDSHNHCDCTSEGSYDGDNTLESRRRSPEHKTYSRNRVYTHDSATEKNRRRRLTEYSDLDLLLDDRIVGLSSYSDGDLSEERKESIRFSKVRKQEFDYIERINGRARNVLQGLELYTGVFNDEEQKNIVDLVYRLQRLGQRGKLRERTYSEPRKWMRGKGRVTIQFGCCYNYALDKNGNPPGIIRDKKVDPMPPLFKKMIKRMVRWHVLAPTCVPDSCIVNIYDEGDCIPPHIDHHDFLRPFCTVSFLAECNILFGSRLEVLKPGEFSGPVSISLPKGSVLILSGNGADIAKHCVPGVPEKRISITFRKMDDRKLPYGFFSDPELQGIKPLDFSRSHEEEQKDTQVRKRGRKLSGYDHCYSPKAAPQRSSQRDKLAGYELETKGHKE